MRGNWAQDYPACRANTCPTSARTWLGSGESCNESRSRSGQPPTCCNPCARRALEPQLGGRTGEDVGRAWTIWTARSKVLRSHRAESECELAEGPSSREGTGPDWLLDARDDGWVDAAWGSRRRRRICSARRRSCGHLRLASRRRGRRLGPTRSQELVAFRLPLPVRLFRVSDEGFMKCGSKQDETQH